LRPLPASLSVRVPEGARVLLDGKSIGQAPLPPSIEVPAGEHVLTALRRGYTPASRQLETGRGQRMEVTMDLRPTATRQISGVLLWGGGGAGVVAAVLGALALERQAKLGSLDPSGRAATPAQIAAFNDTLAQRDGFRGPALAALAASGALAA